MGWPSWEPSGRSITSRFRADDDGGGVEDVDENDDAAAAEGCAIRSLYCS
jgi:hypothetical protein